MLGNNEHAFQSAGRQFWVVDAKVNKRSHSAVEPSNTLLTFKNQICASVTRGQVPCLAFNKIFLVTINIYITQIV